MGIFSMSKKSKILMSLIFSLLAAGYFNVTPLKAEEDVDDLENKIEKYEEKKEKAEQQLNTAQSMLQKNQSQVNVTKNLLNKTEGDITRKEKDIELLEKRIEFNRKILETYLQEAYFVDQYPALNLILSGKEMSQLTEDFNQMIGIKEKILSVLEDIDKSKEEVEKAKNALAEKAEDHEKLLSIKQGEQYEIKSDIKEAQATISELNAKIDKLRKELTNLLGSSVSFSNIMDAANFAAKVTGIRKDYLLGVLVVESNLGRYTGGCNFKESRMSGYRADIFKEICGELKYDYKKQKVSCPPRGYKGTGGAMGVAQFMPDTWQGYKSSIASVTGHRPPDPWNLTDGVVAMALKLTKVDGVKQHKKSAEAKAYCIYLAGGNWAAYCDNNGANYGEKVLYWADNYEKVMK